MTTKSSSIDFFEIIEKSLIGIVILNKNGIVYANPYVYQLLGYNMDEPLHWEKIIHPQFQSTCKEKFRAILEEKLVVKPEEQKFIRKDGSTIYVEIDGLPCVQGDEVLGQIHIRDISKRKTYEKDYVSRNEEYQLISKHISDIILEITIQGEICYISPSVESVLGYKVNEVIGRNTYDFLHPSDVPSVKKARIQLMKNELPISITYRIKNKDGIYIWVESRSHVVSKQNEKRIVLDIRDISGQVETEKLLRQSEKLALIGELSAGVVHEIKNPLTSIKGFLQLMQAGTIETKDYIAILNSEIDRIEQIANDLLGFAKPKEEMHPLDIAKVIDEVVFLLNAQIKKKDIIIDWQPPISDVYVLGDKSQLKQVMINLIKNGIEASDNADRIEVFLQTNEAYVFIKVKDYGCGIPQEYLNKIGESFFTTKKKGTGLGLMVSHKIINNHKGKIAIESEENKGTTFTIQLPIYKLDS
ncbi:PAS domain S-box protein [Aquibacillus albus]|uniref:histidine kinase n=1 Tax=Aquibacillus albus TaxID=1168171 RepID=A0ABS2N2A6_9BACI|nr:PAS domain S-box protein [Aquibacillus albus]MBM7572278.1 two-component system sporulation sensor kinase A [Aquibacillus albus]